MRQARCNVIDQLDREWRQLLDSGAADAAVERWSEVEPDLSFDGAGAMLDRLTDRTYRSMITTRSCGRCCGWPVMTRWLVG